MKPLLSSFPFLPFLSTRHLPLWILQRFGACPRVFVETVTGSVPVLSHLPSWFSHYGPGSPLAQAFWGLKATLGRVATHLLYWRALRCHQCAGQIGVSVCVCACAHAQICAWDCAFKGPGRRDSRTSPSLPALSLPKCLGSLSRSRARPLWPVSWVPGGREERPGHWPSALEDWTLRTPACVVLVLGPLEALTYRNSLCFPFLPLLTHSC